MMLENYTNEELIKKFEGHPMEIVRVLVERLDMLLHPPAELTDAEYASLQAKLF